MVRCPYCRGKHDNIANCREKAQKQKREMWKSVTKKYGSTPLPRDEKVVTKKS